MHNKNAPCGEQEQDESILGDVVIVIVFINISDRTERGEIKSVMISICICQNHLTSYNFDRLIPAVVVIIVHGQAAGFGTTGDMADIGFF